MCWVTCWFEHTTYFRVMRTWLPWIWPKILHICIFVRWFLMQTMQKFIYVIQDKNYSTNFSAMSNCRCMGHLYNPHMKIREKEKFRLCSKSPLTSLLGQEKIESKSLTFWIQIRTAQTYLTQNANNFSYGLRIGWSFFCWKLDFVLFPTQLDSPSNSSGALSYGRNNLTLQQNPS